MPLFCGVKSLLEACNEAEYMDSPAPLLNNTGTKYDSNCPSLSISQDKHTIEKAETVQSFQD